MARTHFCKHLPVARVFIALAAGVAWCTVGLANDDDWHHRDRVTLAGAPLSSVTAGQAYSFTPSARDSQGRTLVFAITNMPSWATFNTSSGQLSGTPSAGSVGTYPNIVIAASDGRTSAVLPAFTVHVLASAVSIPPPTISGVPPTTDVAGTPYSFQPSASGASGTTLAFSIQNKPAWANFSIASGLLNGTPSSTQTGVYSNIILSVSNGTTSSSLPAFSVTVSSATGGSSGSSSSSSGGSSSGTSSSSSSSGGSSSSGSSSGGGTSVAATPTFSVPAGVYASAQSVGLSCSTPSSAIHYTTNGTAPTTSSSVYSSAISVPSTETLEAICAATGYSNSAVASATYTINTSGVYALPANRITTWKPGVTYNGGIPNRTTIYKTLSPLGAGKDDTAQINAALAACPANEVVQLTAGVFLINGNGVQLNSSNCTLRGAGPGSQKNTGINGVATSDTAGTYVVDPTATQLIKADRATNLNYAVLYFSPQGEGFGASINLASDAALGANSITLASNPGIQVGEILLIDELTDSDPDVVWGPSFGPAGDGSRRWFSRQDRSLSQLVEVSAVSGNTITFNTPLHSAFQTAYTAQATRYTVPFVHWSGVENLFVWGGMGGDFHGNISVNWCAYCWVKNVEAVWSVGTNVGFYSTFRSELRDSFMHETPHASPGGSGYQSGINVGASDNLFENNIMWFGNKVDVMRASGGGNVLGYNYMDDAFGDSYPESPEAGINAGHYTTPHMELLEGNYSFAYKGDTYWGNSIYITVYRNWLSGLRAARAPLKTYDYKSGSCDYLYGDYTSRNVVNVQAYSYYTNFVGNVLGMPNQKLLSNPDNSESCYNGIETQFLEYALTSAEDSSAQNADAVVMWDFGQYQATVNTTGNWSFVDSTISTQLRDGNWDWATGAWHWYGIGTNTDGTDPVQAMPNSLYLTSAPAFFGSNTWPWVDPSTGTTYTLPAMYCFQHNQMPTCMSP